MKILVCTQEYYPKGSGIANVAYYIVENLKKKGHSCTVISSNSGDIQFNFDSKIVKFAGLALLFFWNKARTYINNHEQEYDLIWVHNPLFTRKVESSKIYSTVHTTYVKRSGTYIKENFSLFVRTYYQFMKIIEHYCYKRNKFTSNVISPAVKSELVSLGIKDNDVVYIPNGVDTSKFKPIPNQKCPTKIPKGSKVILCVGRIAYQKNPFGLVETVEEINKQGFKITLLWAGDGELMNELKEFIKEKNAKHITLLGRVPHEDLPKYYSSADAFILASFYEGQPLTLLEAMSQGLPCIVSDIYNMSHIVDESKCGKVINFKNKEKAAKDIISYFKSPKFKKDKSNIRKFTVKNKDWKVISEEYLTEWRKLRKTKVLRIGLR